MFASKVIVVVVLAFVGLTSSQLVFQGPCPSNVNVVPDFDVEKYLGSWYEFAKYPVIFEAGGKCIKAQYTLQDDGNVGVNNSMINEKTGEPDDILGYATLVENAKLMVTFPISPELNVTSNYWVLDTDYESYSAVYSCVPLGEAVHSITAWILTRERIPNGEAVFEAATALEENGVRLEDFTFTDQMSCN